MRLFIYISIIVFNSLIVYSQNKNINIDSIISVNEYQVFKDVTYGDNERNTLDIWLAKSENETPLLIFIHGGGFVGGNKESAYRKNNIKRFLKLLENNISFATINYRFMNNDDGILSSLNDAKMALQFLRYNNKKFNINKTKIGLMGSSAGATSSLWIGFSDDMSDKNSDDPILRESTRVSCLVGVAAAHSMNLERWRDMIGLDQDYLDEISRKYTKGAGLDVDVWEKKTYDEEYLDKIDFFKKMDSNDPPFFIVNFGKNKKPKNIADFHHNPMHAKLLKQRGDEMNINNVVYALGIGIVDKSNMSMIQFIIQNLN
tara:strand:- start:318 stop:1265 length:948 start_codon:yes stop_codon:yes gene_type:complete